MIKRTSDHVYLFFIVILTLVFLSLPSTALATSYTDVTVSEAKTMIDSNPSLVILDVRNQSEYNSGHVRNAKLIPIYELESRLDELDMNDKILVYCKLGGRSSTASEILSDNGFLYVYNMLGGITAWMDEGYPVYVKYSSIQEVINSASEGEAIFVGSGAYYEHVVVNRTVSLVAENRENTIICGDATQITLKIVKPNVNVTGFKIVNATEGVYLTDYANSCIIKDCEIVNNSLGIFVKSDNNLLVGNVVVNNCAAGIKIYASCSCSPVHGNIVVENNLFNNSYGVQLINSDGSLVYHNNFMNNTHQAICSFAFNRWDNGYPSGGNYWSDYADVDFYSGSGQDETGSDGIGDTVYEIDIDDQDGYPLMGPISVFDVGTWNEEECNVNVVGNSTISKFQFNKTQKIISFNVTGDTGLGFCRAIIPNVIVQDLWQGNFTVLVDGEEPS